MLLQRAVLWHSCHQQCWSCVCIAKALDALSCPNSAYIRCQKIFALILMLHVCRVPFQEPRSVSSLCDILCSLAPSGLLWRRSSSSSLTQRPSLDMVASRLVMRSSRPLAGARPLRLQLDLLMCLVQYAVLLLQIVFCNHKLQCQLHRAYIITWSPNDCHLVDFCCRCKNSPWDSCLIGHRSCLC